MFRYSSVAIPHLDSVAQADLALTVFTENDVWGGFHPKIRRD